VAVRVYETAIGPNGEASLRVLPCSGRRRLPVLIAYPECHPDDIYYQAKATEIIAQRRY